MHQGSWQLPQVAQPELCSARACGPHVCEVGPGEARAHVATALPGGQYSRWERGGADRQGKWSGQPGAGGHEDTIYAEGVLVWNADLQSDQLGSNSTPSYHLHVVVETLSLSFCIFEMGMLVLASVRS